MHRDDTTFEPFGAVGRGPGCGARPRLHTGLTDQQGRAVTARAVSVVLSSGAGCGKTHVLTERYLSHLRHDGAEVSQVVAITFTERAARQMRGRILQALARHLREAPTQADADTRARHLRGLESAPISTIHAFCGTLLRQHALEAGLDPRFDVLEEVLAVNLEAEALTVCLQKLLTAQAPAGEDLRQLVLLYGWRPVSDGVAHLLRQWDEGRCRPWSALPADRVAAEWKEHAGRLLPRYARFLLGSRPAVGRCLDLLRRHPPQPGKMTDKVRFLLAELPRLGEGGGLQERLDALAEAAKVGRDGSKAWPDGEVYEQIKAASEDLRKELRGCDLAAFEPPAEGLESAVAIGQRLVRVTGEA